jgi:hypothetical protein
MLNFANPLYLYWLPALAIPVVLHLINRSRPVVTFFPSLRFIRRAKLPQKGQRRLENRSLLLVRLLLLAALILILAKPKWSPRRVLSGPTQAAETLLLVDISASMGGWDSLPALRRQAQAVFKEHRGDRFGLIASSDHPELVLPLGTSPKDILRALDSLQISNLRGRHGPALQQAQALLSSGSRRQRLIIASDFQVSDWQDGDLPRFADQVDVQFLDVSPERARNLGIVAVQAKRLSEETIRVTVQVRNYGNAADRTTVQLQTDSGLLQQEALIPPRQNRQAVFTFSAHGSQTSEVRLSDDAYLGDNSYRFWCGAVPPARILAVVPFAQEPEKEAELFFIKTALGVPFATADAGCQLETVAAEHFFALNLAQVDALMLLGAVNYFGPPELSLLQGYLESGGTVLITPGRTAGHQIRKLGEAGLLDASFVKLVEAKQKMADSFLIGGVAPDSRLSLLFPKPEETDLMLFAIRRYVKVAPGPKSRSLLTLQNGDPALLEQDVARGRLVAPCFGLDHVWSDFPTASSFLPVLLEILHSPASERTTIQRLDCGQSPQVPEGLIASSASVGEVQAYDTSIPGAWLMGETPVEVNISRQESQLEKIDLLTLHSRLRLSASSQADFAAKATLDSPAAFGVPLWSICALAVVALLIVELFGAGLADQTFGIKRPPHPLGSPSQPSSSEKP